MNYDKYQFVLEWDELTEGFREEKITEYIEKGEKSECKQGVQRNRNSTNGDCRQRRSDLWRAIIRYLKEKRMIEQGQRV